MTLSVVMILPDAAKSSGNSFATAHGWQEAQGDTFSVPLTADGTSVTHWGTHASADDNGPLARMFTAPPAEALPLLSVMVHSLRPYDETWGAPHFDEVAAANGLARWQDQDAAL
jgi:hypothetical protein